MMTVDVALTQLDVHEDTGANDGIPSTRYMMGDKLPWCMGFLLYCNEHSTDARIAATPAQRWTLRSVAAAEQEFKDRGWWLPPDTLPRRNDIIFYANRGTSDAGGGRHVGIVEKPFTVLGGETFLHTVEGNVGNRVQQLMHSVREVKARVSGYGRLP